MKYPLVTAENLKSTLVLLIVLSLSVAIIFRMIRWILRKIFTRKVYVEAVSHSGIAAAMSMRGSKVKIYTNNKIVLSDKYDIHDITTVGTKTTVDYYSYNHILSTDKDIIVEEIIRRCRLSYTLALTRTIYVVSLIMYIVLFVIDIMKGFRI